MFAAVRRYHVKPGRIADVAKRVRDGLVPLLNGQHGFIAYYAIDAGQNVALAVGVYKDRRSAEAANESATAWIKQNLAELLGPGDIAVGEVIVAATYDASPQACGSRDQPGG
jgi:hypothetical protein